MWPDLAPSDFCLFPLLKEHLSGTHFSSDNGVIASVEVFLQGKMNSSARLVYKSCRNDGTSALKLGEIVWKNKLVTVVVLCFFIYEAGNLEQPSYIDVKAFADLHPKKCV